MKSPVVLFIYKRPDNLRKIIDLLNKVGPPKVYVIADGPKVGEDQKVADTRSLISKIDPQISVHKLYAKKNLGLKERFYTGITEVFKKEEMAIFIEDDCIPNHSFFRFCDTLLAKYKSDERIFSISGDNFQFGKLKINSSYYFSRYPHVWGWATWKRAWKLYDPDLKDWPEQRSKTWLREHSKSFVSSLFWKYIFDKMYQGKINTWDYQLTYASLKSGGLNIIPSVNLVTNVGYGAGATNTKIKSKTIGMEANSMPFPLIHPQKFKTNDQADARVDKNVFLHPIGIVSLLVKSLLGII